MPVTRRAASAVGSVAARAAVGAGQASVAIEVCAGTVGSGAAGSAVYGGSAGRAGGLQGGPGAGTDDTAINSGVSHEHPLAWRAVAGL